jgi:hypothetical protein
MAMNIGSMRHLTALFARREDRHGAVCTWDLHIEGACGELAAAKGLGVFWDGSINTFKRPDLPGVQVRTRSRHEYELIVRDDDAPGARFLLVTGQCPRYCVRGWILGADARRDAWRQTHGDREPAYFVPHAALHPPATLYERREEVA